MHSDAPIYGKGLKELLDQLGLELPYSLAEFRDVVDQIWSVGKINYNRGKCFIHGNELLAVAPNGLSFSQGFGESLSQANTDIFNRMMLIHPEVSFGFQLQVETAMGCQQRKHMV